MDWTALERRREGPSRASLLKSVLIHSLVLVALLVGPIFSPEPIEFESFQIEIVSAAPAEVAEDPVPTPVQEEVVVETPDPEPPEPEVEETPPPPDDPEDPPEIEGPEEEEEESEPEPETPTPTPPPTDTAPPSADTAAAEDEESGAEVNVRLEGLKRDYPVYYQNIINQINACFRPPARGLETVINFVIRRDGTVSDIEFVERSGNATFDYAARGAIECAGEGRFGPLPEDLPYDRLPVQFTFYENRDPTP